MRLFVASNVSQLTIITLFIFTENPFSPHFFQIKHISLAVLEGNTYQQQPTPQFFVVNCLYYV
jgi:hypothetical protein